MIGIVICILLWLPFTVFSNPISPLWLIPIPLLVVAVLGWLTHHHWKEATFRVTNERILLEYKHGILVHPMMPVAADPAAKGKHKAKEYTLVTIKWNQYQESSLPSAGIINSLFGVRPLAIRYGSADGHMIAFFPSLPYAKDLKHYLDKVDSAVRHGHESELKPFILKPKGQRY